MKRTEYIGAGYWHGEPAPSYEKQLEIAEKELTRCLTQNRSVVQMKSLKGEIKYWDKAVKGLRLRVKEIEEEALRKRSEAQELDEIVTEYDIFDYGLSVWIA